MIANLAQVERIGGVERDYLLLEYKGGDRLYIPSDQIDAVRHYTGGDAPALHGARESHAPASTAAASWPRASRG